MEALLRCLRNGDMPGVNGVECAAKNGDSAAMSMRMRMSVRMPMYRRVTVCRRMRRPLHWVGCVRGQRSSE